MPVSVSRRVLFATCFAGLSQYATAGQFGFETKFMFLNRQRCDRCPDAAKGRDGRPFCKPVIAIGRPSKHTSEPSVTAPASSVLSGPRETTLYEFEPNALDNGECSIADMTIQIDNFGNWHAYLTARHMQQTARRGRSQASQARFEFRVDLTAEFGESSSLTPNHAWFEATGPQLVARQDFWIKSAESRRISLSGKSDELQSVLGQLSGFRAEFSWRRG